MMSEYQGILSTLSVEAQGYPFGSVTPYCFDRQGQAGHPDQPYRAAYKKYPGRPEGVADCHGTGRG